MAQADETMAISRFKATCLAVLERVRRTGRPVLVTRFGKPVAQVVPPPPAQRSAEWIGSFRSRGRIVGDLIEPVVAPEEWDALR